MYNLMFYVNELLCLLFSDTHALVQFLDEDVTAIVPISWLKEQENMEQGAPVLSLGATRSSTKLF